MRGQPVGAFAAWFQGIARRPLAVDPARALVLADFEPTRELLPTLPHLCVLPDAPLAPLPGITYARYQHHTNPIAWDASVDDAIRAGVRTAVFLVPFAALPGRTLLHLHKLGIRTVLGWDGDRLRRGSPLYFGLMKLARRALGRLLRRREPVPTVAACRAVLARALPPQALGTPLRIAHLAASLNSGGAERQACYAALGQRQAGHPVRFLGRLPLSGEDGHYLPLLRAGGVPARTNGACWDAAFPALAEKLPRALLAGMPADLAAMVLDLLGELLLDPVDVLHCYVDDCNIVGGIAACLAGVPRVVLSFRNGNPTHFPGLLRPWMKPWYDVLKGHLAVRFCSNSAAGARDYEAWLGLPRESVPVVPNAFIAPPVPPASDRLVKRRELGIAADAPLVAGVFRLHPEKRPLYFLECVAAIRAAVPDLRVVLAGVGPLEADVRAAVARLGLADTVLLLGQHKEVPRLLAAADVLLLVSDWEGTPNVVLEAQHCGCVPVATAAGGTPEALADGVTGHLVGLHDRAGTARLVVALLQDAGRRRRLAAAGPGFVREHFSPEALVRANLALYTAEPLARAA